MIYLLVVCHVFMGGPENQKPCVVNAKYGTLIACERAVSSTLKRTADEKLRPVDMHNIMVGNTSQNVMLYDEYASEGGDVVECVEMDNLVS